MESLVDHARIFRARAAVYELDLERLADGQSPRAMFIACSDARIVPALITGARPGDLLELRTQGGVIPRHDPHGPATGEGRTIEFAVEVLKVTDIIVCGHSLCETVDALIGEQQTNAVTGEESQTSERTAGPVPHPQETPGRTAGDITAAEHCHVLAQVDRLGAYPCIASRLADRTVRLHAWFYEVETGVVLEHAPRTSMFLPL